MKVKTIDSITAMSDLGLSPKFQRVLSGHDPKEVVIAARNRTLTDFAGIGAVYAARITEELDASGFIFHESAKSAATRRLLATLGIVRDYGSTEEYENRQEFTEDQYLQVSLDALNSGLSPREERVIIARFGLDGNAPARLEDLSVEFHVTRERIRIIEEKALRKLRHPTRIRLILRKFPEFVREPNQDITEPTLGDRITMLTPSFDEVVSGKCATPIDEAPIESLDLSARSCSCLLRAGITTVGRLLQMTELDLQKVRNLGYKSAQEVLEKLQQLKAATPQSA